MPAPSRFSKDLKPGDTNGQGEGGAWFGLAPDGQKAEGGQPGPTTDDGHDGTAAMSADQTGAGY